MFCLAFLSFVLKRWYTVQAFKKQGHFENQKETKDMCPERAVGITFRTQEVPIKDLQFHSAICVRSFMTSG